MYVLDTSGFTHEGLHMNGVLAVVVEVDVGLEEGDPIYSTPRRDQSRVSHVSKRQL